LNNMDPEFVNRLIHNLSEAIRLTYEGSSNVVCPHCGSVKSLPIVPLNPILVCICTVCDGYVVPFAGQLLPLNKSVIKSGSEEEKKFEIVQAIMKMLHQAVRALVKKKVDQAVKDDEIPDGI